MEDRWDLDGDGLVDKILHQVFDSDGNCNIAATPPHHDQDGDGYLDVMEHPYLYAANQVTSCNKERNYQNLAIVQAVRCNPAQSPHSDPANVPGNIP
jgi:hypothetical protein